MEDNKKMKIDELVEIVSKYEASSLTLWNFYIVVIFGVLGYVIGKKEPLEWPVRIVFAVAFTLFAVGNSAYLERNQKLIYYGSLEIKDLASQDKELSSRMKRGFKEWSGMQPKSLRHVRHIIDLIVVLLILPAGLQDQDHFHNNKGNLQNLLFDIHYQQF